MAGVEARGVDTRVVRIQSLFREVNDRAWTVVATNALGPVTSIRCECGDDCCIGAIPLSTEEYAAVRRFPTRFAVLPGHVELTEERVIERTPRYTVVEKFGRAAVLAVRMDPQRPLRPVLPVSETAA